MKASSEKRLQRVHPALASAVRAAIANLADQGIGVEVVQGLRTFEEQDELFAKGRTKPGPVVTQARGGESNHNFDLAADLCPFTDDKLDWNAPIAVWAAIGHDGDGARSRMGRAVEEVSGQAARAAEVHDRQGMCEPLSGRRAGRRLVRGIAEGRLDRRVARDSQAHTKAADAPENDRKESASGRRGSAPLTIVRGAGPCFSKHAALSCASLNRRRGD